MRIVGRLDGFPKTSFELEDDDAWNRWYCLYGRGWFYLFLRMRRKFIWHFFVLEEFCFPLCLVLNHERGRIHFSKTIRKESLYIDVLRILIGTFWSRGTFLSRKWFECKPNLSLEWTSLRSFHSAWRQFIYDRFGHLVIFISIFLSLVVYIWSFLFTKTIYQQNIN